MGFLRKVRGLSCKQSQIALTFFNLYIIPLLLCIEKSQLHWYGHVKQMFYEQSAKQQMDALASSKRLREQPRTCWRDYAEDLARSYLGIPLAELSLVAKNWDAW